MNNIVIRYTLAMAIADGVLVDVSEMAKKAGYKYQMVMTDTVYEYCVAVPPEMEGKQDADGRLWDLLNMSRFSILITGRQEKTVTFQVKVKNRPNDKPETVTIQAVIGQGDTAEPVITLMMPEED